jgi:putative hydrolase of the HAD superfamily
VSEGQVGAVLFDYGQVLSMPPNKAAWARMLEIAGLGEAPYYAGYWEFRHAYDRGDLTGPEYWRAMGRHAGVGFDAAQVQGLIEADTALWTDLNEPMVAWAKALQAGGVRTGILSNIGDSIAEGIQAKLPWLTGFYHCTWSHALRMAKPELGIYVATAEALGTEPGRILFIDDKPENIAAAYEVGMQAVQYSAHGAFEEEMRGRGLGYLLEVG